MKTRLSICLAVLAFMTATTASTAFAQHAEKCDPIPKDQWRPQEELKRKLTDMGWKVSRIKIENGCYEVYGRDAKDNKMEVFFHPKTFEVVTAPK